MKKKLSMGFAKLCAWRAGGALGGTGQRHGAKDGHCGFEKQRDEMEIFGLLGVHGIGHDLDGVCVDSFKNGAETGLGVAAGDCGLSSEAVDEIHLLEQGRRTVKQRTAAEFV